MKNQLTAIDSLFIRFAKNGKNKTIRNLKRLYKLGWTIEDKYINVRKISDYLIDLVTLKLQLVNGRNYYDYMKESYGWDIVQKYFTDYGTIVMQHGYYEYNFYVANIVTCLRILSIASIDDLPGFRKSCYWRTIHEGV